MENKTVDRIKLYLDSRSISLNAFDKAISAGNGYFGKQLKRQASIGSDILEKIVCTYPDINPIWLLTGEGQMTLTTHATQNNNDNTPKSNLDINVNSGQKTIKSDPPTTVKFDPPSDPPTHNFGLPKVVVISENERELISLVPVKASAGYLNGYGDTEYVETLPTIRMPNLGTGTHRAFEIKGSSMNPTFHNKSVVIGRWVESFDEIKDRRIYVVITKEYGIVAKRVLNRIDERGVLTLISDNSNKVDYGNYDVHPEDIKELWYVRANLSFEFPEPDNSLVSRIDDLESNLAMLLKHHYENNK